MSKRRLLDQTEDILDWRFELLKYIHNNTEEFFFQDFLVILKRSEILENLTDSRE